VVSWRGLWGSLGDKNNPLVETLSGAAAHDGIMLFPPDAPCLAMGRKPYMEMGVGLDNILTVLRIDYVWRLSYRDRTAADRHGVRVQLHFNF